MKRGESKLAKIVRIVCCVLLGFTFVFSGVVKAVDPLGTTYKIQDYLEAFGPFFAQFSWMSFGLALGLITLEFVIGVNFLFSLHLRRTAFVALGFMLVMTPLTLYLALANPVQDCGCFGDAIVLTNWQTFWKNVVLLVLVVVLLVASRCYRSIWRSVPAWIIVGVVTLAIVGFELYNYFHLPILDFRPYKVGNNIAELMSVPEDAPMDEYKTVLIYEKDGVEQEFTLENYPKDSSWHFVDQVSTLVKRGYEAPIHDFLIMNGEGDDITYDVLEREGYTFLLVAWDVNKALVRYAGRVNDVYRLALHSEVPFIGLTSSLDEDVQRYSDRTGSEFAWCKMDPITLKTIVRANPGLVLLQQGTVVGKWNARDIPSVGELQEILNNNQ